ncbi:MAG: TonB-dependent receptor [Bacteroidetes bacterium 46-16]|jgi:iron complex outermembrane receptor protein|nr:MAG: TonB-dependent receptor [Bacteroidetes bacterium 46-16]
MYQRQTRSLLLLLTLLFLSYSPSRGSTLKNGAVKGFITADDNKPAANVAVTLAEHKKTIFTNDEGQFYFGGLAAGNYHLEVHLAGFETVFRDITVKDGRTETIEVQLKVSRQQLNEVVVKSAKNKYKSDKISPSLRLAEPIKEVPQNIQIVSSAALEDQQVISMSDGVIRNVSGITRLEHWGDMYTRINMRGSQIGAFRNGMNVVNSPWGPLTEDMSFVDHIEFVKGPAGFMMANGDPAGIYNVVTKKPTGSGFNGAASFTFGSFDLYRSTLDLDGKFDKAGKLLYRINLMEQSKNSFRPYEYNDRYSIAPVLAYRIDDKTMLTLEYTLQHAKMSDVGSYYVFSTKGMATLPRDFTSALPGLDPTRINDHSAFLNLQHKINDSWTFTAQAAYFAYTQQGSSLWPNSVDSEGRMVRSVGIWDAASQMKLGQAYLNGDVITGQVHHRILAGLDLGTKEYLADWSQSYALDSVGAEFNANDPVYTTPVNGYPVFDRSQSLRARANSTGGTINQTYSGLYLQDESGFFDNRVRLTLAGRYTYISQSSYGGAPETAKHITPRIGLSGTINEQTSVYALYDQAFLPQAGILRNGGSIKPITGNNIEVGVKRDWLNGRWNTTLSLYRIIKNNELTADPANTATEAYSVVLGQKQSQGIEFDLKGEIVNGLDLIFNYAYTDSKVTKVTDGVPGINVGDRVPGFAKHNVNLWLSYQVQHGALKGLGINAGFSYLADRDTWSWGGPGTENLPDYFRLDGGLFWQIGKFKVTANMFNILDTYLYSGAYYAYGGYYYWQAEAPRNYRLGVSYKF